jgi:hypothetical protein
MSDFRYCVVADEMLRANQDAADVQSVAFEYDGENAESLIFSHGASRGTSWTRVPKQLDNKLRGRQRNLAAATYLAVGSDNRYVVVFADGAAQWNGGGAGFDEDMRAVDLTAESVCVSFGGDGAYAICSGSGYWSGKGVADSLLVEMGKDDVRLVALHPTRRDTYAMVRDDGSAHWAGYIPEAMATSMNDADDLDELRSMHLGADGCFVLHYKPYPAAPPSAPPPRRTAPLSEVLQRFQKRPALSAKCIVTDGSVYIGDVVRGKMHGHGTIVFTDGGGWCEWYVGRFDGDSATGHGFAKFGTGTLYHGQIVDGTRFGLGTCVYDSSKACTQIVGEFAGNIIDGEVLMNYNDGRHCATSKRGHRRYGRAVCYYPQDDAEGGHAKRKGSRGKDENRVVFHGAFADDEIADDDGAEMFYGNGTVFRGNYVTQRGRVEPVPDLVFTPNLSAKLALVRDLAGDYVAQQWPDAAVIDNPHISTNVRTGFSSPIVEAFFRGWAMLGSPDIADGFFALHGTGENDSVDAILRGGFDTAKRRRQNHGPGEYFTESIHEALAYAEGHERLILTYILPGKHITEVKNFCVVCNNPPSWSGYHYCLPVMELTIAAGPAPPRPVPWRWQFFWHGEGEDEWWPHDPQTNEALNALCATWMHSGRDGASAVEVEIMRHNNSACDKYCIDVSEHTQRNLRTNYVRRIKTVNVPALAAWGRRGRWDMGADHRYRWTKFDD